MSLAVRRPVLFATRRARTISYGVTVAAAVAAGGALTTARPTGMSTADVFWSAALVGVLAVFGATARRWTWFLPAGVAATVTSDRLAVVLVATAIVISFVSVLRDTRSRARGAAVAAMGGIALLRADPVGFHGLTALLTAAAITPAIVSGYTHAGRRVKHRARRIAQIAGGTIGLMLAGAALGTVSVQGDLKEGMRAVDEGMEAARAADDQLAAEQLGQAARALTTADSTLSSWFVAPAKSLPLVGPNLDAVGSLAAEASEVAQVTSLAANDADVEALRFVDGRLDPQAVADMIEPLEQVRGALDRMQAEVDNARSPWLAGLVAGRIELLREQVDDAVPDAEMALNAVGISPQLLGQERPQRYLVLFTTPVEARGRFGFPGNFAELVVDDGKLTMTRFGRISELEQGGLGASRTLQNPPEMVARYQRFDIATTWRNLTMTPDFASLTVAAAELYPQSGGQPIDGLLTVDPAGLAGIMRYTGPVEVPGLEAPLTADNVESYLLLAQYVRFADDNETRLDVLDTVARTTFDRLGSVDLPGPRALSEALDPLVDGGHLAFATLTPETYVPLEVMNVTGRLAPVENADTLSLTTANAGGNKIDLFLRRRESYDVQWDPDTGQVHSTVRVTLENTAPAEGWPDYVIGNAVGLPPGTNRSYVSIYSPFQLDASRIGGQPAPMQAETELGRNVYSTFVDIPPGGTVEIELDLTGTIEGRRYELVLPVQPFGTPDEIEVAVEVGGTGAVVSRDATVEDRTARWSSTLDESRTLVVTAPRH